MKENKSFLKELKSDPYVRFIVLFIGLSLGFYGFNTLYIGLTAKGGLYVSFLDQYLNYINWWRNFTIESTASILRALGYEVHASEYRLKAEGAGSFRLVYTCLGYGIMGVFAAFVITFPEKIHKRYLLLLLGLICIQLLNTLRLVLLTLYWDPKNPFLGIDHHDLFNYVVYAFLIAFTYSWLRINKNS
jgi:exosortase/archaeosortase family protein